VANEQGRPPEQESGPNKNYADPQDNTAGGDGQHPADGGLAAALDYAKQGIPAIPLRGKLPLFKGWQNADGTNPEELHEWWGRWPGANVGILTGTRSGYVVIDVDQEQLPEGLPDTQKVRSGSGGYHLYYQHPGGTLLNRSNVWPGCDKLKADGGFVVAPPSVHPETGVPV